MKLEIEIRNCISFTMQMLNKSDTVRGGSRAATTSKMERLEAVNYYHKVLHLGCCSSPRSASDSLLSSRKYHGEEVKPK